MPNKDLKQKAAAAAPQSKSKPRAGLWTSGKALIAPSILSADFSQLGIEIASVEAGGADLIHVDVMDGHFVPNLTIGPMIVHALRPLTTLPLDCHLMVLRPEDWIVPFAQAGADCMTVHAEATSHLDRLIRQIKELGCRAGVSINPATPLSAIEEVLELVDLVLVMSVNPGFGGQAFIESSTDRIRRLVEMRDAVNATRSRHFLIEVDGGIKAENIGAIRNAGCDIFVAGSAVFGSPDRKRSIAALRSALGQ